MDALSPEPARRAALRPWFMILLTAPLLLLIIGVTVFRWRAQREDAARLSDTFAQRQNKTLIHDALRVARSVSNLLTVAASDARLIASATPADRGRLFAAAQRVPGEVRAGWEPVLPVYNRMLVRTTGGEFSYYHQGDLNPRLRQVSKCSTRDLCDRMTLESAVARLPVGQAMVGKALRWYTPKNDPAASGEGTLSVAFRGATAVVVLGVDFQSFQPVLRLPTFPYQERGDLMEDYEAGNYIYLLDSDTDLLAHPRRWHILGLDPATGQPRTPMKTDSDSGQHPLNFRAYERGVLRPYFDRLIQKTFQAAEVDVFSAANLSGQIRVVSIAPIYLPAVFFDQQAPFGYAGVGCALEHFREPKERLVPYY